MAYRLLEQFEATFRDGPYRHRNSTLGNQIANFLYDDLYEVSANSSYRERVGLHSHVLNRTAKSPGVKARRGDGSFGAIVPYSTAVVVPGFIVASGPTATTEIGVEVKVLAKAMIKQIDRVLTALRNQASQFKLKNEDVVTVGLVGVNHADRYVSFEKERVYPTDGKANPHPLQEANEAKRRLHAEAEPSFDEFLTLDFRASNEPPYDFAWVSKPRLEAEYGSALVRILTRYGKRFP